MVVAEGKAVLASVEIVAKRVRSGQRLQIGSGSIVEAPEVAQHQPETRVGEVALLGEESAKAGAGIFEPAAVARNRERHVRSKRAHAEVSEKRGQVGIGSFVVDNKARIDRHRPARSFDRHGVGMSAKPGFTLIKHYVMALAEQPRCRKAGYASSDDGNSLSFVLPAHC